MLAINNIKISGQFLYIVTPPSPPRALENDTTPAESVPRGSRRVRRSDGGEVCVDLDIWKMRSEPSDALPGDQLTVVSRRELLCNTQSSNSQTDNYSSILWRLWQPTRWSRLWSVMRGQLSSSSTTRFSLAQGDMPRCLMASSVMSSQWERERDSREGQWADSWEMEWSEMRTHSSRSILSSRWQERARA